MLGIGGWPLSTTPDVFISDRQEILGELAPLPTRRESTGAEIFEIGPCAPDDESGTAWGPGGHCALRKAA